jgi:hypothetical protein
MVAAATVTAMEFETHRGTKYYRANAPRLIGAIFLGAATDDGNYLVIRPNRIVGIDITVQPDSRDLSYNC